MLVGGHNKSLQDSFAKALLKGKPSAKCHIDNQESYSTNEVDILEFTISLFNESDSKK